MLAHYENQSCPELVSLLRDDDAISFSVLVTILQGPCRDIYTDRQNVIICYSTPPYPVWVWCRDVGSAEVVAEIAQCLKEAFPFEQGYDMLMSYGLLEQLKKKEKAFSSTKIKMGLLSYRLDEIQPLTGSCQGSLSLAKEAEAEAIAGIWHNMILAMENRDLPLENCREEVRRHIEGRSLFLWRSEAGDLLSVAARVDEGLYSKVSHVYTLPQHRRKGYAIHLVHAVTQGILVDGLIPILYTDVAYPASNACYQKIGYRQVGGLCCICG